ncbi:HK97 family phage prohead protease [Falsochrobactrum shanghaiense]|uniref:HK97 family phage prohead protease n=1 Tax=Falsochrobactrum shanghaiense TaxID=2201899 RepID=A0A316JCR8_9HYPH|nr:HK97 family phage prohead protease [Falsochrobactrum shanghaiense]PWL19264.1 HK97 family phage prohead protease [Falsochrobactrum shanghaiense]
MSNTLAAVELDVKSVQEDGTFSGYAAVFDTKDQGGDIIRKGAFAASLARLPANKVKMLWQHDRDELIGIWTKFEEDDYGLKADGRLLLETTRAREAHALMKAGALDGMSIGFNTIRATRDQSNSARVLEEVLLKEVSLVTFPMHKDAIISNVKSDNETIAAIRAATQAIKEI